MDPSSGQFVPEGAAEAKKALRNMSEILKAAGCDFGNGFKSNFPARVPYRVAAFPKEAMLRLKQ
jgi:hypothetical protein